MIIRYKPQVYLVGKTKMERDGFHRFLEEQGLDWPTPNDVIPNGNEEIAEIHSSGVPEEQTLIELFGRNCYMSYGNKAGSKDNQTYLNNLIGFDREGPAHGSVTEHINYNFVVVGAGRGFTHEQVRHRVGTAYSQLSTRYCDFEREEEEGTWDPGFVVPPMAQLSDKTTKYFENAYREMVRMYTEAYYMISEDIRTKFAEEIDKMNPRESRTFVRKAARGAARDLLPIGVESILGMSMNVRTIWNTILLRGSPHAEPQIREIYVQIAQIMKKELPGIFSRVTFEKNWDGTEYVVLPRENL